MPVGAVALVDGRVVAARHNERELTGDPTAHAEVLALRDTAIALGGWRLDGVTLVVTLEPCPMCAGALVAARVGRLVFGASDPRAGACGTLYNLCSDPRLNHELPVTAGVRAAECAALLTSFFAEKRALSRAPASAGRRPATRLSSGGMREWPNRTVSKTVVPHGYRGFESHSLRHRVEPARRIPDESLYGRAGVLPAAPGRRYDRKGVNHGTRTLDIRQAAARPGQEGPGPGKDGRSAVPPRGQGGGRPRGRHASNGEVVDQTRLLEQFAALHEDLADGRISLDDFEVRQEELRAKLRGRLATPRSAQRRPPVAPLEPTAEPGRIGVDAVQGLELLPVRRVDVPQRRVEAGRERFGDVGPFAEGRLGRLGPLRAGSPRPRPGARRAPRAARSGPGRWPDGRRAANFRSELSARSRSKSGGGVAGRSTPPSGSFDPDGVAGEEDPALRVVEAHVVLGVPG